MIITKIETFPYGERYLYIKVYTDEGITGIGECGCVDFVEATCEAVHKCEQLIVGTDAFRTEHIWNMLNRSRMSFFRGSVIEAAISGIDIALWDIKGKYFGVPCYQLMGGMTRDRVRVYANAWGETAEELAESAKSLKEEGYNAMRFNLPHLGGGIFGADFEALSATVKRTEGIFSAMRDAVGYDVDIALESHRGMKMAEAIAIGRAIEKYHPYFFEDPIWDNLEAMKVVIGNCNTPIATGERFINLQEFDSYLKQTDIAYVRPDLCLIGGLTAGKKIAAMAEAKAVGFIPHNPLGPVSTAACIQLAACCPNFEVLEIPYRNGVMKLDEMMKEPFEIRDGFIMVPQGPGLGIELIDHLEKEKPYKGYIRPDAIWVDGSVIDR